MTPPDPPRSNNRFRASSGAGALTPSPSGTYQLKLVETEQRRDGKSWRYLSFQVLSSDGDLRFEPRAPFAAWFAITIGWDSQDRVWLRSSDIGVRMWALESGIWKPYIWQQDGPPTPSSARTIWDAESGADVPVIGGSLPDVLRDSSVER